MHVGMAAVFQNTGRALSDRQIYLNELALADMAEPLGFESIWSVEHHFTDYTMCPDVVQFLSYMAGRTRHVRLGSMVVVLPWHDPVRVARLTTPAQPVQWVPGVGKSAWRGSSALITPAAELANLVAHRMAWLTDYQDEALAGRYKAWVDRVRAAEESMGAGAGLRLSLAVARQLFRLMAIKDEYEVARLLTSERFRQQLDAQFEGDWRMVFHLAPPALGEASGKESGVGQRVAKRAFGEAWLPMLRGLSMARRWRNTWLDPLRWSTTRREEVATLREYEALIGQLLERLSAGNHIEACELAESAEAIRGFGPVRAANAAPVRARWAHWFLLQSRP